MNTQEYLIRDSKKHIADEVRKNWNKFELQRLLLAHRIWEYNRQQDQAVNRARSW